VTIRRAATALVAASLACVVWRLGGTTAVLYFAVYLAATLPGLPLGFMLFGTRHAGGWIAGLLFGYVITALACWTMVFLGHASGPTFVAAWFVATTMPWAVFLSRRHLGLRLPFAPLPHWMPQATTALMLVLLLVPLLTGAVLPRVGMVDAEGNRRYRAYFTADFVWHMALVAELQKHAQHPRNPYLASQPIHYYWGYFLVPAAAGPLSGADVATSLKVNAVGTALLFVSAVFLAAWAALPARPWAVAAAVFLTVVAGSPEGLAAAVHLLRSGQSLEWLRDLNVDALSRAFGGLRVDNLPRAMWYVPQHAMAYALGLLAVPVVLHAGARTAPGARWLAGAALAASVMLNPLVGGIFCIVYATAVVADAWRTRAGASAVVSHALAAAPVALALGWIRLNGVAEGAAGTLQFGLSGPAANAPLSSFVLSFGLLLALMAAGLTPQREVPFRHVLPATTGVVVSALVMHLVVMSIDLFWIGFRTGHLIFACAPALVARGLAALGRRAPGLAWGAAALVLAAGLPTTVIDAFNARDIENDRMGPGFHWTVRITPAEQEALAWIRDHTPLEAVVQADPTVRGRETWSLIPTWAERRMAAGQPISLMHIPAYDEASNEVRRIYGDADADLAWRRAKNLRIDYLYVDRTERQAYPNVAKFDDRPDLFSPVFRNDEVVVYEISPSGTARTSGRQ
jgi:hypothetical protein